MPKLIDVLVQPFTTSLFLYASETAFDIMKFLIIKKRNLTCDHRSLATHYGLWTYVPICVSSQTSFTQVLKSRACALCHNKRPKLKEQSVLVERSCYYRWRYWIPALLKSARSNMDLNESSKTVVSRQRTVSNGCCHNHTKDCCYNGSSHYLQYLRRKSHVLLYC